MAISFKRIFSRATASDDNSHAPHVDKVPAHVAVIMDGNGRWARKRMLPRVAGHKRGVEVVRDLVKQCAKRNIQFLTLFAFSSENWRRPEQEVAFLMNLFMEVLSREVDKLHENNIRLVLIGDRSEFSDQLVAKIEASEALTEHNTGLTLTVAANYGGRWDILQATNRMIAANQSQSTPYVEGDLTPHLAMHYAPEPDLFIRTGGEKRISNFLLWQLAYTELYFTDKLWPDFDKACFDDAIHSYQKRERRYGRTSEQVASH